jgi:glycosyltransferase involved in cell wall biosynthesis
MRTGGAERVAANLANAWTARGDSVLLVATFSGRGDRVYHLDERVTFCYLADRVPATARTLSTRFQRLIALRSLLRDAQPDVVISFLTNVNVAAVVATLGLRFPIAVTEHIYPPHDPLGKPWKVLRKCTYPFASRVVMLTPEGEKWLTRSIPRARGAVIPNPVQRPLLNKLPHVDPASLVPPEKRLLLGVGRLVDQKGFDLLISAFAHLALEHPRWVLAILGEGKERPALEAKVASWHISDRVLLPGAVGNVGSWYERADLYVMSSRFEGFPSTLGEAMAYGCAPVSYDCDTGPRDMIRHEVDGLLVSPTGDVSELARALGRLMSNDEERKAMASRSVEISARYSLSAVLAKWDNLFDELQASRR